MRDLKVTTKGRYGLRAIIELAYYYEKGHISLQSIANHQEISLNYLEQAFSSLKKAGLVKSVKGANGGYIIGRNPKEISILNILEVLEGDLSIVDDVSTNSDNIIAKCIKENLWDKINLDIINLLSSKSLKDMVDEYERMQRTTSPNYCI